MDELPEYGISSVPTNLTLANTSLPCATSTPANTHFDLFIDTPSVSSSGRECRPWTPALLRFKNAVNQTLNTNFDCIKIVSCPSSHPFTLPDFGRFANMDKIALFGKDVVIKTRRPDSEYRTEYKLKEGEIILIEEHFWEYYEIMAECPQDLAHAGVQLLVLFAASLQLHLQHTSDLRSRNISSVIERLKFIPYCPTSLSSNDGITDTYYSVNSRHIQERTRRHEELLSKWAKHLKNLHPGYDLFYNNDSRTCRCDLICMGNGPVVISEIKSLDDTKPIDELKQARNAYGQLAMYEYTLKQSGVVAEHPQGEISLPKNAEFVKIAVFELRLPSKFFVKWLNDADIKVVYFNELTDRFEGDIEQL